MTNIIQQIEQEQMQGKDIPSFSPGDTVVVQVKVKEGTRERLQAFEGVVIAIRTRGLNSAFTVRKISHGEGVERTFQTYSPLIESITVKRQGNVRRAKLYYLRERSGRSARIKEKIVRKNKKSLPDALKDNRKQDTLESVKADLAAAPAKAEDKVSTDVSAEQKPLDDNKDS